LAEAGLASCTGQADAVVANKVDELRSCPKRRSCSGRLLRADHPVFHAIVSACPPNPTLVVVVVVVMMVMVMPYSVMVMMVMPYPVMVVMMMMLHQGQAGVRIAAGLPLVPSRLGRLDRLQEENGVRNGVEQLGERGGRRKARRVRADDGSLGGVERGQAGNRTDNAENHLVHERLLVGLD
jgi:hypothetical protein